MTEGDRAKCHHCNWVIEIRGGDREERAEFLKRKIIEHFQEQHPEKIKQKEH